MKVYFYTNNNVEDSDAKIVKEYLKKSGVEVFSNIDNFSGDLEKPPLEKVEAFIFQGKKLDTKASYLIALVLAQNKEVLCLLPEGSKSEESLDDLKADSKLAKKISIEFYESDNLKAKILNFLKVIDNDSIRNLFNIKYTLRISSKIAEYLNWKTKDKGTKKADWLRDKIQNIMDEDDQYQDFLKDKFKK